jgi:ankyrin repeat protein
MLAARGDHCRAMKMLLDSEADPNAVDKYRWTALMDAANWGNIRACEVLLDAGADVHMAGIQVCHLCHLTFATS